MSNELFRRAWKVTVDNLDVSALDIEFKVLRSLKPVPNKAVVTVWNLDEDHRAQLLKRNNPLGTGGVSTSHLVGIPVQVEAGYIDNTSVIFSADLREVGSKQETVDWKTTIAGDDGGRSYREARFPNGGICFNKGTAIGDILRQCASALGLGLGNVTSFLSGAQITGVGTSLPHTMVLAGDVASQMTRVINSIGLTWSIQAGAIQLLQKGKALNLTAIKLSPSTGLIGSPEASIDASVSLGNPQQFAKGAKQTVAHPPKPRDPSILRARSLLIPGMVPGRAVSLDSAEFRGDYVATEIETVGQSWAEPWGHNLVLRVAA